MRRMVTVHRRAVRHTLRALVALGAAGGLAIGLGVTASAPVASADSSAFTPYALPVTALPAVATSPTWCDGPANTAGCTSTNPQVSDDPSVPYTPVVVSLIAQLEGGGTSGSPAANPTVAELDNAANLYSRQGGSPSSCHNVGPTAAPKSPTPDGTVITPSIPNICWTDAQGVNVTGGLNVRNTTGPADLMALSASFDTNLANVWGQTEGIESRELMVTGLYGPQTDLDRLPNWGRNLTTNGADPYLSGQMVAGQINGIQGWGQNYPAAGDGIIDQMKHYLGYNGSNQSANENIEDQALHQVYAADYEAGAVQARAGSIMCSYQVWTDLGAPAGSVSSVAPELGNDNGIANGTSYGTQLQPALNASRNASPFGTGSNFQTWPLNVEHYSCENPYSLTFIAHDLWDWPGEFASDYDATHSSSDEAQGTAQEESGTTNLSDNIGSLGTDPQSSDYCVDPFAANPGASVPCQVGANEPDSVRVAGIPNNGVACWGSSPTGDNTPTQGTVANSNDGCALVGAVFSGTIPISVFDQGLAQNLYEMQRFGQLGCPDGNGAATTACTSVGGNGTTLTAAVTGTVGGPEAVNVANTAAFKPGDTVVVCDLATDGGNPNDCGSNGEQRTISNYGVAPECYTFNCPATPGAIVLNGTLANNHTSGSAVFDTSGNAPLPTGPNAGATPAANLGTEAGDGAVTELMGEEGATLLKNNNATLPLTSSDLSSSGGVLLTGPGAQFTIADPTTEASIGYLARDQISPLAQLENFATVANPSGPNNINYAPALDPTGYPVPASALSTSNASTTGSVSQSASGGAATTVNGPLDDTAATTAQLNPGSYSWSGYINVPTADAYTFDLQQSPQVPNSSLGFYYGTVGQGATNWALGNPANVNTTSNDISGSPTNAGYTDPGLTNRVVSPVNNPLNIGATNTAVSTSLFAPATAGSTNIKVASVANMAPGETLEIDTLPSAEETATIASVGNPGSSTTVFAPSAYAASSQGATYSYYNYPAGSTNLHVSAISASVAVGDQLIIDAGSKQETDTVTGIGTAGSNTSLFTPSTGPLTLAAGANNIKVSSIANMNVGDTLVIDDPPNGDVGTIASIGTVGVNTTLAAAAAQGATNVKVSSVSGLLPGDTLILDTGASGLRETATIAAGGVGTSGAGGTGVTLTTGLANAHASGAAASDPGTGVTLTSGVTNSHLSGAGVSDPGTGYSLATPLTKAHVGGVAVYDNGTGVNLTAPLAHAHGFQALVQTPQAVGYHAFTITYDTGITQLALPATAGTTGLKVVSPSFITPGEQLVLGGATNEPVTVASVTPIDNGSTCSNPTETPMTCSLSNGGVSSTTLSALVTAGSTSIRPSSVTGWSAGDTLIIDVGALQETRTIVGTPATGGTTLSSPLSNTHISGAQVIDETVSAGTSLTAAVVAGSTNVISVKSTTGISAGDVVTIDTGTSSEVQTVQSASGTTIALDNYVAINHAAGASVVDNTYGVTVTQPLAVTHAAGADLSLPKTSFRFAYSRAEGDLQAAATAAAGAKKVVVFLQDTGAPPEGNGETVLTQEPDGGQSGVQAPAGAQGTNFAVNESYPLQYLDLVSAVAAANPNTVVVSNTTDPVLMPFINQVQSVLQMWYSGSEGGTATARTLLGLNNPGGHVPETWGANPNDNIWSYNETTPLPGDSLDSLGQHPERLDQANPGNSNPTTETEGIFTDYRFFDQEGIDPLFPFGWGLSYTTFAFSNPSAVPDGNGGVNVTFTLKNTGTVSGADVAQVYTGPPTTAAGLEAQGVQFAPRQLAGFKRVTLAGGASTPITIDVPVRSMSYWSTPAQNWVRFSQVPIYIGDADWVAPSTGNPGPLGDPANDPGLLPPINGGAAPVTLASLSPAAIGGYYDNPTLTLSASEAGGTVASTSYSIDGGSTQTYTGPVPLHLGSGSHTISYWSTDSLGDVETPNTLTFNNDSVAPVTTITISPTPINCSATPASGSTCQVNGPATVSLAATDDASGVSKTWYTIDGGPATAYAGPFTVSSGGLHAITYWSTDVAGNSETPKTLGLQINPQGTTTVSGNVPSTLSISVGSTTPNLGAFVAGTAATYTASLAATVTSSAATSTLQAADLSSTFPGYLVNTAASGGPYKLAQGLQVDATSGNSSATGGGVFFNLATTNPATILSYTAPVSNDPVTFGFKQAIGANDPLRTGTYTKTITFTLSTNTP